LEGWGRESASSGGSQERVCPDAIAPLSIAIFSRAMVMTCEYEYPSRVTITNRFLPDSSAGGAGSFYQSNRVTSRLGFRRACG
jgi:hypothetical protein